MPASMGMLGGSRAPGLRMAPGRLFVQCQPCAQGEAGLFSPSLAEGLRKVMKILQLWQVVRS